MTYSPPSPYQQQPSQPQYQPYQAQQNGPTYQGASAPGNGNTIPFAQPPAKKSSGVLKKLLAIVVTAIVAIAVKVGIANFNPNGAPTGTFKNDAYAQAANRTPTPLGTTLKQDETATIGVYSKPTGYEVDAADKQPKLTNEKFAVSVMKIIKGDKADFSKFTNRNELAGTTPYYVQFGVTKGTDNSYAGNTSPSVTLVGYSKDGKPMDVLSALGKFTTCPSTSNEKFDPGSSVHYCSIVVVPDGRNLDYVAYTGESGPIRNVGTKSPYYEKPVVWTVSKVE